MTKMSIEKEKIVFWSYQASKTNQFLPMLTEIYYEVDEFNKQYLEKIAVYASKVDWYPKRQLGCMSMSEIMTTFQPDKSLDTKLRESLNL